MTAAPYLIDTTLRDGAQAADVCFSSRDRREIARALDDLGVPEIEVGFPGSGSAAETDVRATVALGLRPRLLAWGRARISDLWAAERTGVDGFHFAVPASARHLGLVGWSPSQALRLLRSLAAEARDAFAYFSVGFLDASRADPRFLEDLASQAEAEGARRIRVADTVGCLHPMATFELVAELRRATRLEIEFHGHDDLGMAVGNSVAAVAAGADAVSVTVNGLGERAGNAALEVTAMALERSLGVRLGLDLTRSTELCARVARASGRPLPPSHPVVGPLTFEHASGIHCRGLLRDRDSFELVHPEEVGQVPPPLAIGSQSGAAALRSVAAELGVDLGRRDAELLLLVAKRRAAFLGRALHPSELAELLPAPARARTTAGDRSRPRRRDLRASGG